VMNNHHRPDRNKRIQDYQRAHSISSSSARISNNSQLYFALISANCLGYRSMKGIRTARGEIEIVGRDDSGIAAGKDDH
jgi:hypothetical protein